MGNETARPLLLPQNRRLRHLKGVSVRNLTISEPQRQSTDGGSRGKSGASHEILHEAQSQHTQTIHAPIAGARPGNRRRRSTNWGGRSLAYRQKKLESVIENGMADVFFSLHVGNVCEPIYVSEVASRTMNPSFQFFDILDYGPSITRLSELTLQLWIKRDKFVLLLQKSIDLSLLDFVGNLEDRAFPPDCILLHLVDGMYAIDLPTSIPQARSMPATFTSSYTALMQLANLDDSIQDALATRETLTAQISTVLSKTPIDEAPQARQKADLAAAYVVSSRKALRISLKQKAVLLASIQARRNAIEDGKALQSHAQADVKDAQEKLSRCRASALVTADAIYGQRRRICEDLYNVFPVRPTPQALLFTICGLPLPNTAFEASDEDTVAAALGHVARLIEMLQYYLAIPLPYPTTPCGSRSIIRDLTSTLADSQRTFPLYTKGSVRFRFDYAVFLLNKDIECLAESQGLKVIDIRHTLPNLNYLLYVCAAGSSELPARKAGGIKGLLSGKLGALNTPSISRVNSEEDSARRAVEHGIHDKAKLKGGEVAFSLPFGNETNMTLRTKGMRENLVQRKQA